MWHPLPNTLKYYIHCTFIIDNLEDADKAKKKKVSIVQLTFLLIFTMCVLYLQI